MGKIRVKVIGEEDSEPKKKKTYEERKALRADVVNTAEVEVKPVVVEEEDEVAEKVETTSPGEEGDEQGNDEPRADDEDEDEPVGCVDHECLREL